MIDLDTANFVLQGIEIILLVVALAVMVRNGRAIRRFMSVIADMQREADTLAARVRELDELRDEMVD